MGKLNNLEQKKVFEYREILGVLREVLSEDDSEQYRLNNPTLNTMAGYTQGSNKENFNSYYV